MKKILGTILGILAFAGLAFAHTSHGEVIKPIQVSWGLQGAQELINVHPLFVHFPIALLLAAAAFYFLGMLFRKENFYNAGKWTLWFGALSAPVTVWTGLQAAETVIHDQEIHQIMIRHQYLGISILIVSIVLSLWVAISKANIPSRGRVIFMGGLLLLSAMILQEADFGGRMVYGKGVGVGKKNITENHAGASQERAHEHSALLREPAAPEAHGEHSHA